MHELSICTAITDIAERHAAGRKVERVCVDVGGLRQIVPETLAFCWEFYVQESPLAGAVLDIHEIPVEIACRACGAHTILEQPLFRCSACAGSDVEVEHGDELTITSLVLQEA